MKPNKSGIYQIRNLINNKIYIGSTSRNLIERWKHHRNFLRKNKHDNPHLQYSWNKYGENSFIFEILENCKKSDTFKREQYYIDTLKPKYNILPNAGTVRGYRHTIQSKIKIGDACRGEKHPMYSGRHIFYNPEYGLLEEDVLEFSKKSKLPKNSCYKLKSKTLYKSHGWVYIGKSNCKLPVDIDDFYYRRVNNYRPIYSLYNAQIGIFTGTIPEFINKYNIKQNNRTVFDKLVKGKRKMAWGWIFLCNGGDIPTNIDELYKLANKTNMRAKENVNIVYIFYHNVIGQYTGTKLDFQKKFKLNRSCISRLISGRMNSYRGWKII